MLETATLHDHRESCTPWRNILSLFHFATSTLTHLLTTYGYWAVLLFLRRNEHRLEDEAERALPGSLDEYQPGGVRDKQRV